MHPFIRWIAGLAVVLMLCGIFAACGTHSPIRGQETTGLDRTLSTFVYIEEGDLVSLIVGTRPARYRDGSGYMPLEICIANRGLKNLGLTRESFTLIDEQGNRYPAASPRELIENYEFLDLDRGAMLAELDGIVATKFAAFSRYLSKFSPTRQARSGGTNVVRDAVALSKFGYLIDFIYFPEPATGIKGHRFELHVESANLEDPVFVKFLVK